MDAPAFDANSLPALCDTAIRDLAEVRDIGQCLQIRDVMEAARVYAAKHKLAQEAQDACTKIVVMAERRIGQELIAAQQRGELARADGSTHHRRAEGLQDAKPFVPTLADIGVSYRQAHEFRQAATLTDDDIEGVADDAKQRGKPATKADFRRKSEQKRRPAPSAIPPVPPHLSQLAVWIRTGAHCLPNFLDHREAMSLANRHGVDFDAGQVRMIVEFLASLLAGLEADRAA